MSDEYKWHYLNEDENDLPKHNGWYIICHGTEWTDGKLTHKGTKNYDSEIRIAQFFDGKWNLGMVIAWCEKPRHPFEKMAITRKKKIDIETKCDSCVGKDTEQCGICENYSEWHR